MADPTTKISDFKAALPYGGARPTLFDFRIDKWGISNGMPPGLVNMKLYCNVSAIPALTVTPIERIYFGRTVKIPGDMVFAVLTTSFINTEDYSFFWKKQLQMQLDSSCLNLTMNLHVHNSFRWLNLSCVIFKEEVEFKILQLFVTLQIIHHKL